VQFAHIVERLNGFDTPVFGRTLQPSEADRRTARGVIAFLEDRRALYENPEREVTEHLIGSVLRIREHLNDLLVDGALPDGIAELLRPIRAACRTFLTTTAIDDTEARRLIDPTGPDRPRVLRTEAHFALRRLRDAAGFNIGLLAVRYGLDVEEQLDPLIPESFA
jgi:hypothetical protein